MNGACVAGICLLRPYQEASHSKKGRAVTLPPPTPLPPHLPHLTQNPLARRATHNRARHAERSTRAALDLLRTIFSSRVSEKEQKLFWLRFRSASPFTLCRLVFVRVFFREDWTSSSSCRSFVVSGREKQNYFKMPILDSCCRCISLKTGTIITGILGIVISIITLIVVLVTDVKMQTIVIDTLPPTVVKIILAINLAMTVLISVLLIVGAVKRNKYMMLPWVALAILLAVGLAVSVIYTAVSFYLHNDVLNGTIWLVFGLISVAIYVYLWLVVFSFYQLVREGGVIGGYAKPPYRG